MPDRQPLILRMFRIFDGTAEFTYKFFVLSIKAFVPEQPLRKRRKIFRFSLKTGIDINLFSERPFMSNIPQNFIFRFSFPCQRIKNVPGDLKSETLDSSFCIPYGAHQAWGGFGSMSGREKKMRLHQSFDPLTSNEKSSDKKNAESGKDAFEFRIGWHESGLFLTVVLSGKKRPLFCDPSKLETSDGLYFVLDTRDVRDVQRGTRYSHRFLFFPTSGDSKISIPKAFWLPIHRAKVNPNPVDVNRFRLCSEIRPGGYALSVFIPGETLTGFDPKEHNRLGFHYTLQDNELGHYVLQHLPLFPVEEVPSLWSNLVLNQ